MKKMTWAKYVADIGQMRNACKSRNSPPFV